MSGGDAPDVRLEEPPRDVWTARVMLAVEGIGQEHEYK